MRYSKYNDEIEFNIDEIYQTKISGPCKIIENIGIQPDSSGNRNRYYVKVRFLDTGNEKIVRYDALKAGTIWDEMRALNIGKTFNSLYYGPYTILSDEGGSGNKRMVKIRFLNTGYEYIVRSANANRGRVSDATVPLSKIQPTYMNINAIEYEKLIVETLKCRWYEMMNRCYNPGNPRYTNYGGAGVTVCNLWKSVEGFLATIQDVDGYGYFLMNPSNFQLDKDYKQMSIPKSQRIYSPLHCTFLSLEENTILSLIENHDRSTCFGVYKTGKGLYKVEFDMYGRKIFVGIFSDYIAAINAYEQYYAIYYDYYNKDKPTHFELKLSNIINHLLPPNFVFMTSDEIEKYKVK